MFETVGALTRYDSLMRKQSSIRDGPISLIKMPSLGGGMWKEKSKIEVPYEEDEEEEHRSINRID